MGAETMSKKSAIQQLIRKYIGEGKIVGMICAGASFSESFFDRYGIEILVFREPCCIDFRSS